MQNNQKVVLAAVQKNGAVLNFASKELQNNEKVVLAAVQKDGWVLVYASKELQNNEKVVLAAVQQSGWALKYASKEMQNNEKIVLAAVQQYGWALEFASKEMQNNEKVVLAAVQQYGWALEFASKEMQNNEKIVLAAVQRYGLALDYASKELQNNEKIVLAAVQQNGWALQVASKELRNNEKIVLAAVQKNGESLQYASEELRNKKNVVLAALRQDADAYKYVGESLRSDPDVLRIVRGLEPLPPFSVESISGGIRDLLMSGDSTIGLFSSEQIHKDGAVDPQKVKMLLSNLKAKAKEGIYFTDLKSNNLYGGTCSAMTSMLINEIFPQKIRTLQELEKALKKISTKSSLQRCITQSCKSARDLQMAFNAIRISPNHKGSSLDFSKHKIGSLAGVYQMSIGKTSEPLEIRSIQAPDNFKQAIDKLPEGIYWLRAINKADNEKLENFGHSLMFIKGKDFLGLYDPSVGMKIASLRNTEGFIQDTVLFSLRRYALHEARFYEIT
jgi:predicted methyltransferase